MREFIWNMNKTRCVRLIVIDELIIIKAVGITDGYDVKAVFNNSDGDKDSIIIFNCPSINECRDYIDCYYLNSEI